MPSQLRQEPRYWQQWLRQQRVAASTVADDSGGARAATPRRRFRRDWAMSLGPGAKVGAGQYPAKFSFSVSTAHCASDPTPDFVVFNTSAAGSPTQASVVAFDNLYSGCTNTVPMTYWAYNTGGTVVNSTTMSLDGTQIAFVQSVSSQAQLVLLKWAASSTATSTSPGPISVVSPSQYSTCTTPCMTTIAFSGNANDTNSAPYVDYSGDTIYVGDDAGALHKFTPIFHGGTPAEVTTNWPVTVASGLKLNSPVYDSSSGRVFVGSSFNVSGAQLFAVVAATGLVTGISSSLGKSPGIVASTTVDSSAGQVYVYVGNDGSTTCSGPCEAVYQFPTNFSTGKGTEATVGNGGSFPLYAGDFDHAYFSSANGTGNLVVCGGSFFGTSEPTMFKVPVNAGVMSSSSVTGPGLATSNVACSPVTDIFNSQFGGVDRLFASVTSGSDAAACSSGGCIVNLISSEWQASKSYPIGQTVLDSGNFMQVVAAAGTTSGTIPSFVDTCGNETTDGTVTWVNAGFLTPVTPQGWSANTFYSVGFRILDSNLNIECALETGVHSGVSAPTWNTAIGGITQDSLLQWRNGGPLNSRALPASGGTSGIILDNIVGSGVLAGASQIYFSPLGTGGCGAGNGCAVQASQSNLN